VAVGVAIVTKAWLNYFAFWIEGEILGSGIIIQNRYRRNSLRIYPQNRLISASYWGNKELYEINSEPLIDNFIWLQLIVFNNGY
jgi:hypothetical protein